MEMEENSVIRTMNNDEYQDSQDCDDIYTILATEITVRKCKIEQKKEKAKMLVFRRKEIINKLNHSGKKRMYLMRETEEISSQRVSKVANIGEVIESRTSLEMVLSDLINNVSFKTAETEEKNELYKKAIKRSIEIRESYKAVYEEFPLAIKRREAANEVKKVNIEIRQIKMDIDDFKYKQKLKREVAEKRLHIWAVNMAKAYLKIQEKKSENSLLQNKLSELMKLYEDMKAGKNTGQWTSDKLAPIEYGLKGIQEFHTMIASLKSDAAATTPQARGGGLFNWKNTLFNCDSSFSISKETQKAIDEARMCTKASYSTNKHIPRYSTIFKAILQPQTDKGIELQSKVILKSTNVLSDVKKIVNDTVGIKRKFGLESKGPVQKQAKQLAEDAQKFLNTNQKVQDKDAFKVKVTNQSVDENSIGICEKKIIDYQKENRNCNKETIKKNNDLSSSSMIKSLMVSLTPCNKNKDENPIHVLIENKKNHYEFQKNAISKVIVTAKTHAKDNATKFVNYQPVLQQENHNRVVENNCDNCETQIENNSMVMDPTSPPDLVPVENYSQSLSQKMNSSDKMSSQNTELSSSMELDRGTKVHYERLAAEPSEFVYPVGGQVFKPTAAALEEVQTKVTSQYFPSSPQSDLNTPTSPCQGDYQPMPYSPPANLLQNDSTYLTNVLSPPEANIGGFSFGKGTASSNKDRQEESGEGRFTFDFMSGSAKKNNASIFSLF